MTGLRGKVVLLTGGSRGLGPVIAKALAGRGADIVLAARSKSGLKSAAMQLARFETRVLALPVDLKKAAQREDLVRTVLKRMGRIDVLINNAGLETEGAYLELSWQSIQENIEVNLTGSHGPDPSRPARDA